MPRGRYWTESDDASLRLLWGDGLSLAQIAARLGRTPTAVYARAARVGLPLGVPQGWEGLTHAADRCGFSTTTQLRYVLRWAKVAIRVALSRPTKRTWHRRIVETDAVDEAMARWSRAEYLAPAARRLGMCQHTLRHRLAAVGLFPPGGRRRWRLTDEQIALALGGGKVRELAPAREAGDICADCGYTHAAAFRRGALERALPATVEDLREAHPCWWAGTEAADRRLWRDLDAIGATSSNGTWSVPKKRAA